MITLTEHEIILYAFGLFLLGGISGIGLTLLFLWRGLNDPRKQAMRDADERTEMYFKHCERQSKKSPK